MKTALQNQLRPGKCTSFDLLSWVIGKQYNEKTHSLVFIVHGTIIHLEILSSEIKLGQSITK